jgi:hypothetical protein
MTSSRYSFRTLLAALLAVSALAILAASASAAITVPPSNFEGGDGDLIVNHGGTDWATPAPHLSQVTDDDSAAFSAFVTGSKEQDPGNWDLGPASAPSKADILHAAYANDVVGGDLYFYGAFQRLDGSGNANVSFELNRLPGTFANGNDNVPIRSEGDLLITFDGNNSNGVRVGMCIWHGDRDGESSSATGAGNFGWYTLPGFGTGQKLKGNDNCTLLTTVSNATATGSMNNGSVNASSLNQFSASIADNQFGEMSVNVSDALRRSGIISPCVAFGSAWIHSRSSDAPLSSMQDFVQPTGISAATPCSIDLEKSVAVQKPGDPAPATSEYADADSASSAVVADTGDTLNYLIVLTNPGANAVTLKNGQPEDSKCGTPLTLVSQKDSADATDGSPTLLNPGDVWTYSCTHVFGDTATDGNLYTNTASVIGAVGDPSACTAASASPCVHDSDPANVQRAGKIEIEKVNDGGAQGDLFDFTTSLDLSASGFSITGGQTKTFDHLVPNSGGGLSYTVTEGALAAGYRLTSLTCDDTDDSSTTADTATIVVDSGETVHCIYTNRFTSPGIAIDKTGPANATAGDLLPYTLTVTNPGQESLSGVAVTDQQCTTTPALQVKNEGPNDTGADFLDPGDSWVYSCSGQTALGQSSFDNTACVSGSDVFGRGVNACDSVTTALAQPPQPPQQVVLGERVEPGTARIAGATGCVARKFKVTVRGTQIAKVEFRVDGKKRASLSKPDSQGRFVFKVDPKKFKPGSHLLQAKSTFTTASGTPSKTMKLRFARCVRRTAPAFTG